MPLPAYDISLAETAGRRYVMAVAQALSVAKVAPGMAKTASFAAMIVAFCGQASGGQAQNVLPKAVDGYRSGCLKTVPDFKGYKSAAASANFREDGDSLLLEGNVARVDIFPTEQGCACLTALIAPDQHATALQVIRETTSKAKSVSDHPSPQIVAILQWDRGQNALQLESDTRGSVPLVRATLLSNTQCPKN